MTVLTELVRNIMLIILLTTFLEMLMPSSSMQRFVKVIMGLFILIAILNPILRLINQQQDLEAFVWQQENSAQFNSILKQGECLQKVNEDLFWENYQQQIERQMESLLKLIHGVDEAEVQIKLAQTSKGETRELFRKVAVTVGRKEEEGERGWGLIKPVKIVVGEINEEKTAVLSREEQLLQLEIVKTLCHYFGLKDEQISVSFI